MSRTYTCQKGTISGIIGIKNITNIFNKPVAMHGHIDENMSIYTVLQRNIERTLELHVNYSLRPLL
jgi:hypothetical protein